MTCPRFRPRNNSFSASITPCLSGCIFPNCPISCPSLRLPAILVLQEESASFPLPLHPVPLPSRSFSLSTLPPGFFSLRDLFFSCDYKHHVGFSFIKAARIEEGPSFFKEPPSFEFPSLNRAKFPPPPRTQSSLLIQAEQMFIFSPPF